ncbi:hypothetical protein [Enterobacter kobei]|jgi:hypothetical protein|uniref:hypothetical protein n=1 Tax=Enterobacter kobei TaxID=208224 RepID=UPI002003BC0E|nr:hypothetical protein [Enterobacter kobei]MCK7022134.1 hypothetical protein [Enterobacter kobei]DAZ21033.1 MAG TPA: hypothetical protein [Caudoviricetes sp.]HCR1836377.1 hypothetical protein [Enterobacter kobei]HEO9045392.1 hypothetical protein [Enterobacter kobei]
MEAKSVNFEWKELFKTDIAIHYRVICKIVTTKGIEVAGSAQAVINKAPQITTNLYSFDGAQLAELSAFNHANQMLYKISGENIPDHSTLTGIAALKK